MEQNLNSKGKTISVFAKIRKILLRVLLSLLLLLSLLFFFISLPSVQTSLAKKITNSINKKYGTNISINKVSISFLGNVNLKGVYVEDHKKDTLIYINKLGTSILSIKNAIDGKLNFGSIDAESLKLYITTYKGEEDTNLDVFVAKLDSGPSDPNSEPFLLTSENIVIEKGHFKLTDYNAEEPVTLNFKELFVDTNDFKVEGPEVQTNIRSLAFLSEDGYRVEKLSAGFYYCPSEMQFNSLSIETPLSNVQGNLMFLYDRDDFSDFLNKVEVIATFRNSTVSFDEINKVYREFGKGKRVTFSSNFNGTINNLIAGNLDVRSENTYIKGDFTFTNLFENSKPFSLKADIENLSSNYYQLKELLPNILGSTLPSSMASLGQFSARGQSFITEETVEAQLNLFTELGTSYTNLTLKNIDNIDFASYKGHVSLKDFNLGRYLNDKTLGNTTLELDVDGSGFTKENVNTKVSGAIENIFYNGYSYNGLLVEGTVKEQLFDGKLVSNDENFKMAFEGLADFSSERDIFNFKADVEYADLVKTNLFKRDSLSIFSGSIAMNVTGNSFDDLSGIIIFNDTRYQNQNDTYVFEDFQVISTFEGKERYITVNSPDIINGFVRGKFFYKELGNIVRNSIGSIYTNYNPFEVSQGQYLEFNLKINDKIVEVFYPEIDFGDNTTLRGSMVADDGDFKLTFRSPEITAYENTLEGISVQIDNKNPLYNTFIEIGGIKNSFYNVSDFNLINATIKDTLFFRTEFKGGKTLTDVYNLNFYHTFNKNQKSVIGLKTSDVGFKGNNWVINRENNSKNKVTFNKTLDSIFIEDIVMNFNNEQINLRGEIRDTTYKDIYLKFTDVNLDKVTPSLDSLNLKGTVNGDLNILQRNKNYLPSSNLTISGLELNNILLGDLNLGIIGNENLSKYMVDANLINDQIESLNITGDIDVVDKKPTANLKAFLNEFNLEAFSPLGGEVISNIRGFATGEAQVKGNFNNPSINGQLLISNGGLKIPYLNVDVDFSKAASVKLYNQTFEFDNITLADTKYKTRSILFGTITHTNFEEWYMDLKLNTGGDRFLVLDTEFDEDELYYGTGFISGEAEIYGLTDALTIKVDGTTERGTSLKIPVSDATSIADASFINFIDKNALANGDIERQLNDVSGLELAFDLDVTPDAEVEIVLDQKTGSTLRGTGAGNLLIEINTNGKFRMWGDFITFTGDYNFKYGGFIDKKFRVLSGGTITWDGDPLKANLNISGIYGLNANPAVLLDNAQQVTRKIETEVVINLTGELLKPQLEYEIKFPKANAVTNSELQYRLEDRNTRELQALSLLGQGIFVSQANISASQALASNLAETASSMLTQILNAGDGKFDFNINYEVGERNPELDLVTQDRVGVTVSTQINERILINGRVGLPVGGVSETVVAGDVEVQILLNEEGTLSAVIFNRENQIQQILAQQQGYTQGVGLTYQVDFNTFGELMRKIFNKKPKEKNTLPEEDQETTSDGPLGGGLVNFSSKKKKANK